MLAAGFTTATTLLVGRAVPLPGSTEVSGIDKRPSARPLHLGREGFDGDEQGDRKLHGGPEKAVHHYAADHYPYWRSELGLRPVLATAGAFGENISADGLTEDVVAVGDVFRLGTALLQVSQGRQPCWKLNLRFGQPDMARRVQKTGRTGWYYRVLEPGLVAPHDRLTLVDRVAPDWTLHRLWHIFYVDRLDRAALRGMADLAVLSEGWRARAAKRLQSGRVEDWSARLDGRK